MTNVIEIIGLGETKVTHKGKSIILPNELILFAADEIRGRLTGLEPDFDVPAPEIEL